jgi:hypothetical protein
MGLFNMKETRERNKQVNGKQIAWLVNVDFIGGVDFPQTKGGSLVFNEKLIRYEKVKHLFSINLSEITDISIEGRQEISRRVTLTRLLTTGIFAFALTKKSKEKEAFIVITLDNGAELGFHTNRYSDMELKNKLFPLITFVKRSAASHQQVSPVSSSDDQSLATLEKLGELKDKGVITEAEFTAKKKQLLGL